MLTQNTRRRVLNKLPGDFSHKALPESDMGAKRPVMINRGVSAWAAAKKKRGWNQAGVRPARG